jgi:hypothetical protein
MQQDGYEGLEEQVLLILYTSGHAYAHEAQ